jgi:hypothetical protein
MEEKYMRIGGDNLDPLDRFKKRMSATSGTSLRDELIKDSKQLLQSIFLDDASANPNIVFWNTTNKLLCRIFGRKTSSSFIVATIQVFIDSILTVGDIIYDMAEKQYWMCTKMFNIDDVHKQGEITLCNYTLKWQNSSGTILSYPCIVSTNSNDGTSDGKLITVGDAIYTIKLPFDSNTVLIDYDDRFFIDDLNVEIPQVYAVSKPNRTEFKFGDKGLIELTMKQSKYNDKTDRKDLGICNYIEPTENPNPPDGDTYAVIASDSEDNKVIVGYKDGTTLSPKFYNADKTENSSIVSVWEFALPAGLEGYIHLNYTGNNVNIYADDKFELYGTTIIASVSNGTGNYKGNITLTLGGWY